MSNTHLRHNGEYVYGVTVTKHEAGPPSCGHSASLGLVHSVEAGRLVSVEMKISEAYGPTADEAGRSLDASQFLGRTEPESALRTTDRRQLQPWP
jgi:hypothetical protein